MLQVYFKHAAELSGINLDQEAVQKNDFDDRHIFLSIKAVSAIFRIVDLLQRPKIFLPEPKSYICRFIAPPCPPPPVTNFFG